MKINEFLTNGHVYFPHVGPVSLLKNFGYSRGVLPHLSFSEGLYSFTTRLYDSVPAEVIVEMKRELGIFGDEGDSPERVELYRKLCSQIQNYEDQGYGSCFMKNLDIAEIVCNAIKSYDQKDYLLLAWSVMPNHIHIVMKLLGYDCQCPEKNMKLLAKVAFHIKGSTSRLANKVLGRTGSPFWHLEYYDRYIRNEQHLRNAVKYVINNPRKIGFTREFTGTIFDDMI